MILAISGSLKRSSVNSAALRAAARAAALGGIAVTISDAVRELPHFDPDREAAPPEPVLRFRAACAAASGLLLAVPEYAFGIPGAFKNALDWTVASGSLYRKSVALLYLAAPGRGAHARRALDQVLTALDVDFAHHPVPIGPNDRDASGEISNDGIHEQLLAVVEEPSSPSSGAEATTRQGAHPEMSALPLTGGCNCRAVRFEVTEPLLVASYCHCKRCQRRSGAAASANAHPAPGAFRIVAGEDRLHVWKPDGGGEKWFCGDCGSSLFGQNPSHADPISIRMGAFDEDPGIRPSARQFVAYAAPWESIPDDGLPRHPESRHAPR